MGDLSKNFSSNEFKCKCGCGVAKAHPDLVAVLQDVRDHFGTGVKIISGYRCRAHNKAVGGATRSRHMVGDAADISVNGVTTKAVHAYLNKRFGAKVSLGLAKTFVHVDTRKAGAGARWTY